MSRYLVNATTISTVVSSAIKRRITGRLEKSIRHVPVTADNATAFGRMLYRANMESVLNDNPDYRPEIFEAMEEHVSSYSFESIDATPECVMAYAISLNYHSKECNSSIGLFARSFSYNVVQCAQLEIERSPAPWGLDVNKAKLFD